MSSLQTNSHLLRSALLSFALCTASAVTPYFGVTSCGAQDLQTASSRGVNQEKLPDWNHYLKPGGSMQPPRVETPSEPEIAQQGTGKPHYEHGRLRIGINERGTVDRVDVVKKVGFGLDEKAVEQVKTWKFKPAMLNGRPVPVQFYVDIKYKLYAQNNP